MLALLATIDLILSLYAFILVVNVIFSWLHAFNIVNAHNQFVRMIGQFLYTLTEPILRPVRRILPNLGAIDISPLIVLLVVYFLRKYIATSLYPMF